MCIRDSFGTPLERQRSVSKKHTVPLNNKIKDTGKLNATGFATGSAAGAAVGNIENVLGKDGKETRFMGSGPVPPKKPSRSKVGQKVASESKK